MLLTKHILCLQYSYAYSETVMPIKTWNRILEILKSEQWCASPYLPRLMRKDTIQDRWQHEGVGVHY